MIQLNRREKAAVAIAAGCIALFLIVQFVVFPALDRKQVLERQRIAQLQALAQMQQLQAEFEEIQAQLETSRSRIARKNPGFTLFSFLDQLAGASRIKDYITYMKPSTAVQKETNYTVSTVEMKLESIPLDKLVRYLHAVETSQNMVEVRRLSLTQTGKQEKFLDAVLEMQTIDIS